jgi:hypothetical protein
MQPDPFRPFAGRQSTTDPHGFLGYRRVIAECDAVAGSRRSAIISRALPAGLFFA